MSIRLFFCNFATVLGIPRLIFAIIIQPMKLFRLTLNLRMLLQLSFYTILFIVLPMEVSNAQSQSEIKKTAEAAFAEAAYSKALNYYLKLSKKQAKSPNVQYRLGRCYFELTDFEKALSYFRPYLLNKRHDDEALYYTASALHYSGNYKDALRFYKLYLRVIDTEAPNRAAVKLLLLQCNAAQKLSNHQSQAIVVTLGKTLNSAYKEYLPTHHPDFKEQLFFSSNRPGAAPRKDGQRSTDIWVSAMDQGNWQAPELVQPRYNSAEDEILLAFPDSGYQILYFRGPNLDQGKGQIDNYKDGSSEALQVDFAPLSIQGKWNGDYYLFSDSLVIFSSERPNNYGGKDLYYALRRSDGEWSEAINMGPEINSRFDERSPFLAVDGRSLFFSANHPNSMGGYDVYKSVFSDSLRQWQKPINIGIPINSEGDDLFFRLEKDGLRGYISSIRNGGEGGSDMYSVYFRKYLQEQFTFSNPPDFADVLFQNKAPIVFNNATREEEIINKFSKADNNSPKETSAIQSFVMSSIFYDGVSGQFASGSDKTINSLKSLLTQYKDIRLVLTVHTDDVSPLPSNLFLAVQQGEKLAAELLKDGISPNRILLRGCAQNYPIARNYSFDGSPNTTGQKLNRRIDIDIYNANQLPIRIENNRPMVSSVMIDTMAENYSQRLEGLCYKVHLLNTPTLYTHQMLEKMKDPSTEKKPGNPSVSYSIGLAKNFVSILSILETAKEMGFGQAKIVPYINGFPINDEEVQSLFVSYPDLENYLEYVGNR